MRKRTEDVKNNIITAAYSLFLDKGYMATSVDDIAAKAGVAKQTVYGYFADKRSLFVAVVGKAVGTPWDLKQNVMEVKSAEELRHAMYLILAGINKVSMRPRYIKLLRTIVSEAPAQPELGDLFRNGVTYRSLQVLSALFSSANESGVTHIDNPELAARFFLGGIAVRIFLDGLLSRTAIKRFTEDEMQEYVNACVRWLMSNNKEEK